MQLVTILMVTDMERSLDWYRRLLPPAELLGSSPHRSELSFGGSSEHRRPQPDGG